MLDQVIANLAVNARDAMPNGGTLRVEVAAHGADRVALRVRDEGEGIPEHVLPHVFEPFFTTKSADRGTGLGLATVYGVVTQHGGKVSAESTPGRGTTMTVLLPRSSEQERASGATSTASAAPHALPTLDVLLVEDQAPLRRVARRLLEDRGHRVHEASSAADALRVWEQVGDTISVLLVDVILGDGPTGAELAATLRAKQPRLPVIFMSGSEASRASLARIEGHDFIAKPFDAESLARLLEARFPKG
jgi:hypothetical protein